MKKSMEKVQTGWQVPVICKEAFIAFCEKVGTLVQDDCAGALAVWPYLNPIIREKAKLAAKAELSIKELEKTVKSKLAGMTAEESRQIWENHKRGKKSEN